MTMRKMILAASLLLFGATTTQADPILTPLLVTYAGLGGTAFTIGATAISYASVAPYELKAPK